MNPDRPILTPSARGLPLGRAKSLGRLTVGQAVKAGVLVTVLFLARSAQSQAADLVLHESVDLAVRRVKPSLVRLHVVSTDYADGREMKSESSGSGVIIRPEGFVVTNHHVAGHATRLFCTLPDKSEVEADLVGTDPLADIAVVKLRPKPDRSPYPTVDWGDSDGVQVGDRVLAMGSPMALSQSVTLGIISNTEMVMPDFFGPLSQFILDGEDVGSMVLWLGHDAEIYGGNSGGPLVNLKGEVIGINEIKMALSGAIPGNLARRVAFELIEKGKVERAWLGFELQPQLKAQNPPRGVLVAGSLKGSPADSAGFKPGDLLVRLGDRDFDVRYSEQLPRFNLFVAQLPIGTTVEAKVLRQGEEKILEVVPERREEVVLPTVELKEWGMTVRNLSFMAAREMKLDTDRGVWVTSTRQGGPAGTGKPSLQSRDLILEVSGTKIESVTELVAVTERILAGRSKPVSTAVLFQRSGQQLMTVVEVGIRKLQDPGLELRKAWLPIGTQVVTREIANLLGLPGQTGVRVTRIYPHPSADGLGLRIGDIITHLDGEKLAVREMEDYEVFPTLLRQYKVGNEVILTLMRDGNETNVSVRLEESPKLVRELRQYRDDIYEFTVREIAFTDLISEKWDLDQQGALVSEVTPGGWAALADLSVGDLLLEINHKRTESIDAVKAEISAQADSKSDTTVFLVQRGIHTLFLEVEPQW